jgi:predicted ArsR family transcriptional regulator
VIGPNEWVTLAEGAARLGVAWVTLRRHLRRREAAGAPVAHREECRNRRGRCWVRVYRLTTLAALVRRAKVPGRAR